ncbi:hypothetical protein NLM16_35930 [Bradyrhizobium brasilense]|uniref:AbiJ-NTD4 domain-containing protein n=1 Tax=Bradyrhizobium brasilense TaxID=1419277 RepID=UPI0028776A13|nr:hypothetical protein [Bradyrhizobium brasilense]MCP3419510.1 hypothetical protein [Bradyrhizobium brasilense]
MIEDVFFRRYPQQIYWGDRPTAEIHQLFVQVAHIIFGDLVEPLQLNDDFFKRAHDALARETGRGRLYDAPSWDAACGEFLTEVYDLWKDRHGTADTFLKRRLSLVELLFRLAEERARELSRAAPDAITKVARAVDELNSRFRQARIGMHYHNGILQFARDELTETRIAEPCWALLRDAKWANVDRELKEAIEHADGQRQDAAFHAAKALESTIKIISDDKGWSTGRERGAANYIDNLVSHQNGRFLVPWEGDTLKAYFIHVRNPHGHGAGSQPPPALTSHQTDWAVETAMAWIKNLIRRT